MNTYTLDKEQCYNPYLINSKKVERIIFFNSRGIIATHNSGWFGSNNGEGFEFEDIQFIKRLKASTGIKQGDSFFTNSEYEHASGGYDLYIRVDGLVFEYLPNQKWCGSNEYKTHLIDKVKLLQKGRIIEHTCGVVHTTTLTALGEKKKAIVDLLGGSGAQGQDAYVYADIAEKVLIGGVDFKAISKL